MKSLFASIVFSVLVVAPALAQEEPRFEGAVGYTFTPGPVSTDLDNSQNRHGWFGMFAYNFDDVYGVEVDSVGSYGTPAGQPGERLALHGIMAGPRFSYREFGRFVPFGRVLAGFSHRNLTGLAGWDPAAQVGGGFILHTTRHFGFITGIDFRGSWRGEDWDEYEVYGGLAFRN